METLTFQNDIRVLYITATSYPEGIMEAQEKLHSLIPVSNERKFFGISRPENGTIIYRAGAEEIKEGEAAQLNCETLVLKRGEYISLTVTNYLQAIQNIEGAFQQMLSHPDLDPQGYCVEWYFNDTDVKCMIRLEK